MKYTSTTYKAFTFCLLFISTSIVSAETAIAIDNDDTAQEVFLGGKWKCRDSSNYRIIKPFTFIEFETATKREVKGKVTKADCPHGVANFKGEIKQNTVKYSMKSFPKDCWKSLNGSLVFYKNDDGNFVADGFYNGIHPLAHDPNEWQDGRLECEKE